MRTDEKIRKKKAKSLDRERHGCCGITVCVMFCGFANLARVPSSLSLSFCHILARMLSVVFVR